MKLGILNEKYLLFLLCVLFPISSLLADDYKFNGTTFTISSNVELPVYVRFNGKKLEINSRQYTTHTSISCYIATITDSKGNGCMYQCKYENGGTYTHYYFNITGVYSSAISSEESEASYYDDDRISQAGNNLGKAAISMRDMERYYYDYYAGGFSLAATISPTWGENLELRLRYGSSNIGGDVTGMVGYDWINGQQGDKLTWNVGIGVYFGGRPSYLYLWDADLAVKFGKSNKPYNNAWTCMLDLSTTHLIGPLHIIGLTAGAGIGLGGNGKSPDFVWDARGGIVIYFLQWDWL